MTEILTQKTYICGLLLIRNRVSGSDSGKKEMVESMFDSIAWRYDFLNHFLSFGFDRIWRRKAIRTIAKSHRPSYILDVATGTGDLALASLKLNPLKVTGIDISENMLEKGRKKIVKKGLSEKIELLSGDSEKISFEDNHFDVAMVAFGVRNFNDPLKGLTEMKRVIRSDGLVMILEFSRPQTFPFSKVYSFYFHIILPFFGRLFSHDRNAYRYLPESVMAFPDNEKFVDLMNEAGFTDVRQKRLTGGVASIYTGIKPPEQ
jgi:demethylmenaquinone methyltransferase/2-methoxy-6-polyprenyl-1,4-benzoquinol methylase